MAQATTTIVQSIETSDEQKQQLLEELEVALTENSDGVKDTLALLQQLHEKGLLDFLVSLVKQGNDVLRVVVELATKPEYMGAIQKVIGTVKGFSDVDTESFTAALKSTIALLQQLYEKGLLDFLVGLLEQGNDVARAVVNMLTKSGSSAGLKTMMAAVKGLSTLDAEALATTMHGVSVGLKNLANVEIESKSMGIFDLMRAIKDPDVNAAIRGGLAFLKGLGQVIRAEEKAGD